jgi:ABC-type lipoprotein release transport system permease subunit
LLYRDPQLRKKLASNASQYLEMNNWQEKKRDYFQLVDRLGSPGAEAKK